MSGASAPSTQVRDSIASLEVEQMQGLSVSDSVVNISIGGKHGPRSISDAVTEFRHRIRDLHRNGGKEAARQLDETIAELCQSADDQLAAGLPSSAAAFIALQALGHLRRGRADKMASCIAESLALDPHCEQAHLIAGEFAHQQSQRMAEGEARNDALKTAISHHQDVWKNGREGGTKNNAGYHLCIEFIEVKRLEEARSIKQDLLQSMTNPSGRKRVEAISIPSQ